MYSRKKLILKRSQESVWVRSVPVKRRSYSNFYKDCLKCLYCKRDTATSLIFQFLKELTQHWTTIEIPNIDNLIVKFLKELTQHRTPIENPNIFNFCIIVAEIFAIQNLLSIPFIRRVDDPA